MKVIKLENGGQNYTNGAAGRIPARYAAVREDGSVVATFRPRGAAHKGAQSKSGARCVAEDMSDLALRRELLAVWSLDAFREWAARSDR